MFLELVDSKITLPYMLYLMNIAHKYKLVFSRVILLYILLRECKGIWVTYIHIEYIIH